MTSVLRGRAMAVAAAVLAVPCVLYLLPGAWALLWVPAVLLAVGAALNVPGARGEETTGPGSGPVAGSVDPRVPEPRQESPAPNGGNTARGTRVCRIALPSAVEDYDLLLSAVVHWRWAGYVDLRMRNPIGPAVYEVVSKAAEVVQGTDPEEHGFAGCALGAQLAVETAVSGAGIVVWAEDVELALPDEDADRLRRVAHLRKDRELRMAERQARHDGPVAHTGPLPERPTDDVLDDELGGFGGGELFGEFEPFDGPAMAEAGPGPGPGSDVDGAGFESYWWPADTEDQGGAVEQDVQVAVIQGLADRMDKAAERSEFVREQVLLLERFGFTATAERLRGLYLDEDEPEDTVWASGDPIDSPGQPDQPDPPGWPGRPDAIDPPQG